MPIESALLYDKPVTLTECPQCKANPFEPFLRGEVQRLPRKWIVGPRQDYCAVICRQCKQIVAYESPEGWRPGARLNFWIFALPLVGVSIASLFVHHWLIRDIGIGLAIGLLVVSGYELLDSWRRWRGRCRQPSDKI